ncbi:hypothetical protein GWK47_040570 [Chionoecetes opilio]|uniref:Uncharacterized protein n=1 Tax=Chionoecetes opilio TaxID=41210 RepID=A0A8J4YJN3_CHIOP|nr:hypothetical protein GWK47_040570 [Chionoecetes opilio]
MGLHNLEEELALFLVFGQPEVEGLDERHSSLGCVVDDAKSLDSAAGLDVRFLFLPLPRVGGQEVGLDIKSFEEAEGIFRGEGGQCYRRKLVMMGGLFAWRVPRSFIVENGLYNCLFVGDRET